MRLPRLRGANLKGTLLYIHKVPHNGSSDWDGWAWVGLLQCPRMGTSFLSSPTLATYTESC